MAKFGIILKAVTVMFFAAFLYFIIDFIIGELKAVAFGSLNTNIRYFLCVFGIFNAINVFVSLYVAGWFTNKILNYLSS